jgi:hypothetical protein
MENPLAATDKQASEQHPHSIPPFGEFWKVLESTTGQDRVMLLAQLHTGARTTWLFELIWNDVDLNGKRIRLWTKKRKGGRDYDRGERGSPTHLRISAFAHFRQTALDCISEKIYQ